MDLLPAELISKIIKNLDLNDILLCSQLNRKWNSLIKENVRIKKLSVKNKDREFDPNSLKFLNNKFESIDRGYLFNTKNEDFFQSQNIKIILKNLKQLYIELPSLYYSSTFDIAENLNQFTRLEVLQINQLELLCRDSFTLSLPELKILSIGCFNGGEIKLDLPKLEIFKNLIYLHNFKFLYPNQLNQLYIESYSKEVNQFVNLEHLYCEYLSEEYSVDLPKDILVLLPKLKKLHCSNSAKKDIISGVLSNKNKLRRIDFKLYFNGIPIETLNELDLLPTHLADNVIFVSNIRNNFQLLLDNYSRLSDSVHYVDQVNYSKLDKFFNGNIDSKFFDKFTNIDDIVIDEPEENKEKLFEFIKKINKLRCLTINLKDSTLGQEFYDQLYKYQPNISHLRINDQQILNQEFILNFKNLGLLSINQKSNYELISKSFDQLKNLTSFSFNIKKGKQLEISIIGPTWNRIKLRKLDRITRKAIDKKLKFTNFINRTELFFGLKLMLNESLI